MRRVLIVTPHFPPDSSAASHRIRLLAPHLPASGWDPTVLTVEPHSYEATLDSDLAAMVPPGVRVVRVPAWSARWTRAVGIGDLGLRAFDNLRRACSALLARERFDALFVTTYPVYPALLGPMLKRRFHLPFVLDFQDPWVGSWGATVGGGPNGTVDLRSRASRLLAEVMEPLAVRAADGVTAVSAATYEDVFARVRPDPRPVCATLPLGWEARDFDALDGGPNGFFDPQDGCIHLCYVGTLLPNGLGTLRALLTAARAMRNTDPATYARLRLRFFGTSNQSDPRFVTARVAPIARELGVNDVVFEVAERIPYASALRVLKQASGILLLGSSEPHYTASKLFPALLARRPVLAIFHEASSVVSMLERVGGAPSIRVVTYGSASSPAADSHRIAPALSALLGDPVYDEQTVHLDAIGDASAPSIAARLAAVFDRVADRRQPSEHQADRNHAA